MEPKNNEGFELELIIEELEQKIAPGDTWPVPGGNPWGGRGGGPG